MAQVLGADPELPLLQIVEESSAGKLRTRLDDGLAVDLVILELGLPDLGGLLGLACLRNAYPTIPVIVMSERGETGLIERCALLGAAGFIQKPGTAQQIRQTVREVLDGHRWLPEAISDRSRQGFIARSMP